MRNNLGLLTQDSIVWASLGLIMLGESRHQSSHFVYSESIQQGPRNSPPVTSWLGGALFVSGGAKSTQYFMPFWYFMKHNI